MSKGCTKWFKNKSDLTKHIKQHDQNIHACKYCDYMTDIIQTLNGHRTKHSAFKQYVYLHCGKGFHWSQELIRYYIKCPKLKKDDV